MTIPIKDMVKALGGGGGVAFSVLVGGLLGYKIGKQFELGIVGLVLGSFGGLFGAVYNLFRMFSE